jgi:hypothetical protein
MQLYFIAAGKEIGLILAKLSPGAIWRENGKETLFFIISGASISFLTWKSRPKACQKNAKKQLDREVHRLVKPPKARLPLVSRSLGLALREESRNPTASHTIGRPLLV